MSPLMLQPTISLEINHPLSHLILWPEDPPPLQSPSPHCGLATTNASSLVPIRGGSSPSIVFNPRSSILNYDTITYCRSFNSILGSCSGWALRCFPTLRTSANPSIEHHKAQVKPNGTPQSKPQSNPIDRADPGVSSTSAWGWTTRARATKKRKIPCPFFLCIFMFWQRCSTELELFLLVNNMYFSSHVKGHGFNTYAAMPTIQSHFTIKFVLLFSFINKICLRPFKNIYIL